MKQCSKCKEEKPQAAFSRNRANRNGFSYYCKKCEYSATKKYRNTPKGAKSRKRANENRRKNHARKVRASDAVYKALNKGTLKKLPCGECGTTETIEAHHEDYKQPLDVTWLCRAHHLALHGKSPVA